MRRFRVKDEGALYAPLCGAMLLAWGSQAESATQAWTLPEKTPEAVYRSAKSDLNNLGHAAATPDFWRAVLLIGGISLASAVADNSLDRFAVNHGNSGIMPDLKRVGNALPFVAIGYSATMFLASNVDSKPLGTAYSALAAGGMGALSALGLKYAVGRARPSTEQGASSFTPLSANNGDTSWPSMHTTVMWAMITPYAKSYDAPWLYGVAVVTNAARVIGRDHWFSDTMAGSLLGYAIGNFIWQSHQVEQDAAVWTFMPNYVAVSWRFE